MTIKDILDEEFNTEYFAKELTGLAATKKQLDGVIAANPLIAKSLAPTAAEIDKKINSMNLALADYNKRKKDENKTGIGTNKQIKPPVQGTPVTPPSTAPATKAPVKQAVPSSTIKRTTP